MCCPLNLLSNWQLSQQVLYAAENDTNLRRGQVTSPIAYFNILIRRKGSEEAFSKTRCHICGQEGHVSRSCPDRAAGPILQSQLGAWGHGGDPNPALKGARSNSTPDRAPKHADAKETTAPTLPIPDQLADRDQEAADADGHWSWGADGDPAEDFEQNQEATAADAEPDAAQSPSAADSDWGWEADGGSQGPGDAAAAMAEQSPKSLLKPDAQQQPYHLDGKPQRGLRPDAPAWEAGVGSANGLDQGPAARLPPVAGSRPPGGPLDTSHHDQRVISGQLKVREWGPPPLEIQRPQMPGFLQPYMPVHQQTPSQPQLPPPLTPPVCPHMHPQQAPPHISPPPPSHVQLQQMPPQMLQSQATPDMPMLVQRPPPLQQLVPPQRLPPYLPPPRLQMQQQAQQRPQADAGFGGGPWSPMAAPMQLPCPAYGGVAELPLEPFHSSGMRFRVPPAGRPCGSPTIAPPTLPVAVTPMQHPAELQNGWPSPRHDSLAPADTQFTPEYTPGTPQGNGTYPPSQHAAALQQLSLQPQQNQEPQFVAQVAKTGLQAQLLPPAPMPAQPDHAPLQLMQQPQLGQPEPGMLAARPQQAAAGDVPLMRSGEHDVVQPPLPALEASAAMLWATLQCLCCSRGLRAALISWAASASPGQLPDAVADAVRQLIKDPCFTPGSASALSDAFCRNRLVQNLQYLQGAVSSTLGPEQSIEGSSPAELVYLLVHHLGGALAGHPELQDAFQRLPLQAALGWQVQQLVACSGCGPQGSVQPLAIEQMFFNVSAAGLIAASAARPPAATFAQVLLEAEATAPWACTGCGAVGVRPMRKLQALPPDMFVLQMTHQEEAPGGMDRLWSSIESTVDAGTLFCGMQQIRRKAYTLQAVLCRMQGSFGNQAGIVTVDGDGAWRLHCGFDAAQTFDSAYLSSATSMEGGVAPFLAFYTLDRS